MFWFDLCFLSLCLLVDWFDVFACLVVWLLGFVTGVLSCLFRCLFVCCRGWFTFTSLLIFDLFVLELWWFGIVV